MQGIITQNINNDNVFDLDEADDYHYFVHRKFPFPIIHEMELQYMEYSPKSHMAFVKRLNAEKYRILQLIAYYEKLNDYKNSEFYIERNNKLEEEHPEWII